MSNFDLIKEADQAFVANTYGRFPVAVEKGVNATCYDFDGKEYIDFSSGIGVNSLGFCDKGWIKAVTEQLNTLQHISNLYYTSPCIEAAKLLCERTGMKKCFSLIAVLKVTRVPSNVPENTASTNTAPAEAR